MKSSTTLSSSSPNSPPEYQVVLDDLLLEKRRCARPDSEDESRTGRALGPSTSRVARTRTCRSPNRAPRWTTPRTRSTRRVGLLLHVVVTYVLFHKMLWSAGGEVLEPMRSARCIGLARRVTATATTAFLSTRYSWSPTRAAGEPRPKKALLSDSALPRTGRTTGTSPGDTRAGSRIPHGVSAPSPRVGAGCPA
jgi:hypothetical protein